MPFPLHENQHRMLVKPVLVSLCAALLVVLFAILASEVMDGETHAFDAGVLHAAQSLRAAHPWLADAMRDASGLGSTLALTLFTLATCGYLLLTGARALSGLLAASIASAALLVPLLKSIFGRARPGDAFAEFLVPGLSFASGHASMSAVVFLTFGALLASTRRRPRERVYILGLAGGLTLLVGLSRIALGVHWATDVLGGWAVGTAWAIASLLVAARFVPEPGKPAGPARDDVR